MKRFRNVLAVMVLSLGLFACNQEIHSKGERDSFEVGFKLGMNYGITVYKNFEATGKEPKDPIGDAFELAKKDYPTIMANYGH